MTISSDDIVTRLRDVGFSLSPYGDAGQNRATVFRAADEIERLRAEVAYLKQGWYPTPAKVQSYRWWKKAVRGE